MRKGLEFKRDRLLLGLVILIAICPALAMRWADWVPGLWTLQVVSIVSVLAGYLLARSRFSTGLALLLTLVYGLFVIGLFCGLLLPAHIPWHERIPEMVGRQANWLIKAANVILDPDAGDTSRDSLIFIMQTNFLLWWLGFLAAWYTFRNLRIWGVILPSGLLLLITVINYYGREPLGLVLVAFLFFALLYIVSSHYLLREQDWIRGQVIFNRGTRLDFLQAGFLIVLVAVPLAWAVPNVSAGGALHQAVQPMDSAWQRIQDGWTQLFASLKSYGGEYSDPYGNALALGGPRQITPRAIMDVSSNDGRYWRAKVYDHYDGSGWSSSSETRLIVLPDRPLELPEYRQQRVITATFTSYLPDSGLLFFPHQPLRSDRQARFNVFDVEDGPYDIASVLSRYVIYEGKNYKSWGTISSAQADELRTAGTDYPDWIAERYLQLPEDTSERVIELAETIAALYVTPYDKTEALTRYLRENITYNEAIEAPPVDVDPLEYVLFDSREGYCNYYASALAVMLRSQNIPARLVVGYTQGTWRDEAEAYRVNSTDSHVWTEVFFPDYGWVEFEATAAQPIIIRDPAEASRRNSELAEGDQNLPEEGPDILDEEEAIRERLGDDANDPSLDAAGSPNVGLIVGGVLLLLALAAVIVLVLADRRSVSGFSVVAQIYDRMNQAAHWIGVELLPNQTPHERATVLVTALPDASAPVDVITDLYVEERFGRAREGVFDEQAHRAWRELRPTLVRQSLLQRLHRFQRNGTEG